MSAPEIVERRAVVAQGSYDPESRTFTAVAATTSPVRRNTFAGPVNEVLSLDPASVRLGRLQSGRAPLLDSHQSGSVSDQIGVIQGARIDGGKLMVDVQLSSRDDPRMNQIRADLQDGILRNVSIGYASSQLVRKLRAMTARRPLFAQIGSRPRSASLLYPPIPRLTSVA